MQSILNILFDVIVEYWIILRYQWSLHTCSPRTYRTQQVSQPWVIPICPHSHCLQLLLQLQEQGVEERGDDQETGEKAEDQRRGAGSDNHGQVGQGFFQG